MHLRLVGASVLFGATLLACSGVFSPDPSNGAADAASTQPDDRSLDAAPVVPNDALAAPDAIPSAPSDSGLAVPRRCAPAGDWGRPELVRELSGPGNEFAATLTQDELTIHFARDGAILTASRASITQPFGTAVALAGLGNDYADDNPALTSDDRTLFFSSRGRNSDRNHIFRAPMVDGGVGPVTLVSGLLPDVEDPFPIRDGGGVYYSATRNGPADDIFFATGFPTPEERLVPASDPAAGDGQPVLSSDELRLFFGSRRSGLGGSDIFVSQRASTSATFTTATWLGPVINSVATDLPVWVSKDGCVLYLTSDRTGGAGVRDLYRSTRGM